MLAHWASSMASRRSLSPASPTAFTAVLANDHNLWWAALISDFTSSWLLLAMAESKSAPL